MKAESKNKESFIKELKSNLAEHISDKDLDAWFFNWFDDDKILTNKENKEINSYLNKLIPGNWFMISLSGNGTNVGLGTFYEPYFDTYLELACYSDDEDAIDDFYISEKCIWKFDKKILDTIKKLRKKYES